MTLSPRWILGPLAALLITVPGPASAATTPEEALNRLKDGNTRFVTGTLTTVPTDRAERERLAKGEAPLAVVLSCADSRVPPEYIFNAGLGDLYVVRTAGQVADTSVVASIEHATGELHAPLLVVMGHESCAVVRKAVAGGSANSQSNLGHIVGQIRPAVERTAAQPEHGRVRAAIFANIEQVINEVLRQSPAISLLVDSGKLQLVGAYYDLTSGRVAFTKPITQAPIPAPSATNGTPTAAPTHPAHSAPRAAGHPDTH